ncbi:MAG: FUSC family protein, partial [Bacteroidetes bacterium]|nr:FUSC family protein [Bacteroidota bacterium]
ILIISLGLTIYNSFKPNEVIEDTESITKEKQSEEDAIEELESLEIED